MPASTRDPAFVGLLDERVQHDDALSQHKTVERAADAGPATRPELEQSIAEGTGVRQAKAWAVLGQKLDKPRIIRKHIDWPRFDLGEHTLVEVFDLERHAPMLANTLT